MALYAIIARLNPAAIRDAVIREYGANHFAFSDNLWFVPDNISTKAICDKLGLTDGPLRAQGAQGVVLRFDAYSGLGPTNTWTWLSSQGGAIPNG